MKWFLSTIPEHLGLTCLKIRWVGNKMLHSPYNASTSSHKLWVWDSCGSTSWITWQAVIPRPDNPVWKVYTSDIITPNDRTGWEFVLQKYLLSTLNKSCDFLASVQIRTLRAVKHNTWKETAGKLPPLLKANRSCANANTLFAGTRWSFFGSLVPQNHGCFL